jgi:hypothetical protein
MTACGRSRLVLQVLHGHAVEVHRTNLLNLDLARSLTINQSRRYDDPSSRGVAQPGRALGSGPRGRWFESNRPDQFSSKEREQSFALALYFL